VSGSRICLLGCLLGAALIYADAARSEGRERTFHSDHLDADVVVLPSVFFPNEAEVAVLPFMKENAARFAGKSVLEIGTGSGIISLYAAKLGATKVVSTDISEQAVRCATRNASRLGADEIIDVRLVPASDIDLGLSIVRGLDAHLNPGGVAILLYNSLFYHYVMVKFASYEGWEVRNHGPAFFAPWEAETLFNYYLARLLEVEKMDADAFRFDRHENEALNRIVVTSRHAPLFPGNTRKRHPGIIVIERKETPTAGEPAGAR
jgi:SAM-dependent methyltransferase